MPNDLFIVLITQNHKNIYDYIKSIQIIYKTDTIIFVNSGKGSTSDPILLNLENKINLKRSDKYVTLPIFYHGTTWNKMKKTGKNNKFKMPEILWDKNFQ